MQKKNGKQNTEKQKQTENRNKITENDRIQQKNRGRNEQKRTEINRKEWR